MSSLSQPLGEDEEDDEEDADSNKPEHSTAFNLLDQRTQQSHEFMAKLDEMNARLSQPMPSITQKESSMNLRQKKLDLLKPPY